MKKFNLCKAYSLACLADNCGSPVPLSCVSGQKLCPAFSRNGLGFAPLLSFSPGKRCLNSQEKVGKEREQVFLK